MKFVFLALVLPCLTVANLLWPKPQFMEMGLFELDLDNEFHITGPDSDILVDAIDRYTRLIMHDKWIPVQIEPHTASKNLQIKLRRLKINVEDINKDLEYGVDESYELEVPDNETTATINSNTTWGAIRGLETFSQLIQSRPRLNKHGEQNIKNYDENDEEDDDDEEEDDIGFSRSFITNVPINIRDYPKFSHRGLMLDTSRNYFPVKDILRTIDAMAYNKMNVFHWHITDSHSFPIKLENAPELAHEGAYKLHQKRLIYRKRDVAKVIEYAYKLGIRVIPEIDMPAHTGSWALSHKDIVTCSGKHYLDPSNDWSQRFAAEPGTGQLNPVLPKTYNIVNKVITEIGSLFKDNWYHGGGDEPIYKCWEQDESVLKYMKENNMTGVDLLGHFLDKELNTIQKIAGKVPILWEDPVTNNHLPLSKEVVLQVWINPVREAVKKGYKVIASNYNFWYLDCGHGGWSGNDTSYDEQTPPKVPESLMKELKKHSVEDNYRTQNWGGSGGDWCSPFKSWQRIYSYDPTFNLTKAESKNVLGGEVALWTEQTDETALDVRLWPRAAAAAEVLWSGRYDENGDKRDIGNAMPRMFDWRYRLLKRGIRAEALQPLWCGQNPHMCDSQYPF